MCRPDIAGPGEIPTADKTRIGYCGVGRAEWPACNHGLILFQHTRYAEDLGVFDGLIKADER